MTNEERKKAWHKEYQEFQRKMEEQRVKLVTTFANENNEVEVGDIVTDHYCSIVVQKIGITTDLFGTPYCFYTGLKLKKNGQPTKRGEVETVYEQNLKEHKKQNK